MLLVILALGTSCLAQNPPTPSAEEIVSRMLAKNSARAAALHVYESMRTYQVSYKGFPKSLSATAVVRLDFKAPDQKQFTIVSQQGSGLLINRVIKKALDSEVEAAKPDFRKRSALDETNYTFKLIGNETVGGRPCYVLQVMPKREDKYLYDGKVCVDAADYAVVRIDAKPAKNPSFWISRAHIDNRNEKVGEFWFPASLHSTSHVRLGGDAELNIDYHDYRVTNASPVQAAAR